MSSFELEREAVTHQFEVIKSAAVMSWPRGSWSLTKEGIQLFGPTYLATSWRKRMLLVTGEVVSSLRMMSSSPTVKPNGGGVGLIILKLKFSMNLPSMGTGLESGYLPEAKSR